MTRLRLFSGWRWINNNGEGSVGAMPSKVVRERYLRMKMLSCREKVTVLEPKRIREKLYQITAEIAPKYEGERE